MNDDIFLVDLFVRLLCLLGVGEDQGWCSRDEAARQIYRREHTVVFTATIEARRDQ